MRNFQEIFGFEANDSGDSDAQQTIINARLMGIGHRAATARKTIQDLNRALGEGIGNSNLAGGMQLLEKEAVEAESLLAEAGENARVAGFAVRGAVEDLEVTRIFGLETYHSPLSGPEAKRVSDVLKGLIALLSCAKQHLKDTEEGYDIGENNAARETFDDAEQSFREAHSLTRRLDMSVYRQYIGSVSESSREKEEDLEVPRFLRAHPR